MSPARRAQSSCPVRLLHNSEQEGRRTTFALSTRPEGFLCPAWPGAVAAAAAAARRQTSSMKTNKLASWSSGAALLAARGESLKLAARRLRKPPDEWQPRRRSACLNVNTTCVPPATGGGSGKSSRLSSGRAVGRAPVARPEAESGSRQSPELPPRQQEPRERARGGPFVAATLEPQ